MEQVVGSLTFSAGLTLDTLEMISRKVRVKDAWVVARCALETITNAAFICVGGAPTSDKMLRYYYQRKLRDRNREINVAGITASIRAFPEIEPDDHPELKNYMDEFTSKKGREIESWTSESMSQKIETICEKYKTREVSMFVVSHFLIYAQASEALHGTLVGVLYALGHDPFSPEKERDREKIERNWYAQITSIIIALTGCARALNHIIADEFDLTELEIGSRRFYEDERPLGARK